MIYLLTVERLLEKTILLGRLYSIALLMDKMHTNNFISVEQGLNDKEGVQR